MHRDWLFWAEETCFSRSSKSRFSAMISMAQNSSPRISSMPIWTTSFSALIRSRARRMSRSFSAHWAASSLPSEQWSQRRPSSSGASAQGPGSHSSSRRNAQFTRNPESNLERVAVRKHVVHFRQTQLLDELHGLEWIDLRLLAVADFGHERGAHILAVCNGCLGDPAPPCFTSTLPRRWRVIHSSSDGKRTRTAFTPPGVRRLT